MLNWLRKKAERHVFDKQVNTIWKAMGLAQDLREANDPGSLHSYRVETVMHDLNGFDEEVNIARTKDGIILLKKSNGDPISNALTLSAENLQKIPADIDEGDFVYLIVKAKYSGLEDKICSCFVSRDGTPYGDQRAFWWSLAKNTLNGEMRKINNTRMTDKAFEQVRSAANGIWQSAVENDGSIEHMRDTMVLLRNKHLEVFSNMKNQFQSNPSVVFGINIACAMVLATQAEDRMLENIAFERLKQFIWEPGKEPIEFNE